MNSKNSVTDRNGIQYELVSLLGRGGQGAVYAVKGGALAIKIVSGRSQHARDQLRNQLAFVKRLPIQELSLAKPMELLAPPHAGYVMELLTGMVSIQCLLTPPKGSSPGVAWYLDSGGLRRRLLILARVARILSQVHGKGLAYADPSPGNIFISEDPTCFDVCFIDTDNLRHDSGSGSLAGVYTPGFGAPELVQGKSGVTTLTDAHAFAVIAFQTLALVHPFVGDLVNEGEPELEEQAFAGMLPWIDDANDESNRASFGVPRSWVLSSRLSELFERTFGPGRRSPEERPGVSEWAERLFAAADATIVCSNCEGAYYLNRTQCPWCEVARPAFVTAEFNVWEPNGMGGGGLAMRPHVKGKRAIRVDAGALTSGRPLVVTRRLAFGALDERSDEPVVELSFDGRSVSARSLNDEQYGIVSACKTKKATLGDEPLTIGQAKSVRSWTLHFGDMKRRHRVLNFGFRPAVNV